MSDDTPAHVLDVFDPKRRSFIREHPGVAWRALVHAAVDLSSAEKSVVLWFADNEGTWSREQIAARCGAAKSTVQLVTAVAGTRGANGKKDKKGLAPFRPGLGLLDVRGAGDGRNTFRRAFPRVLPALLPSLTAWRSDEEPSDGGSGEYAGQGEGLTAGRSGGRPQGGQGLTAGRSHRTHKDTQEDSPTSTGRTTPLAPQRQWAENRDALAQRFLDAVRAVPDGPDAIAAVNDAIGWRWHSGDAVPDAWAAAQIALDEWCGLNGGPVPADVVLKALDAVAQAIGQDRGRYASYVGVRLSDALAADLMAGHDRHETHNAVVAVIREFFATPRRDTA